MDLESSGPHLVLRHAMLLHDLNNLVHAALGWMDDELAEGIDWEERRAGVVQSLSQLRSQLDRHIGALASASERVDLASVRDVLRMLRPRVPSGVTCVLEAPDEAVAVAVAPLAFERMLLNLLLNALDVVGRGGRIAVSVTPVGSQVHVDITDDGPGLPAGVDVFQPGVSTRSGRGLGLASARDLAREAGGDLRVVGSDASGTTFRLTLWRAPE